MKYLLILLMVLAGSAQAQSVIVKSGEHGGFTRLVLSFPAPVDWVLGRTSGGYGLRITGANLSYDLSSTYRLITKDRLRSIWVDPVKGDLLLGIDCPCHAIPFELNKNVLVIDIKDGAPPQNSSFELSLKDGNPAPPIRSAPPPRPRRNSQRAGAYDWLTQATAPTQRDNNPAPGTPTARLDTELRLESFRVMLIDEVGRGATQGIVEMERPARLHDPAADSPAHIVPDNARAAVNELPGIEILPDTAARSDLTVRGETCPAAADLEIGAWAGPDDAATELARAHATFLTEFDVPDAEKLLQAVNTHLHFGFGAEARQLLTSFLPVGQTDVLRTGLSYLVDGDVPPENPFHTMQSCDSAAALWALLAAPGDKGLPYVNGAAVSRTFLSLPAHLRTTLGPETAKRLLKSGDNANAEVVRQSFERAVPRGTLAVDLLTADQALQAGDPVAAEAALPVGATGETAMAALFTLVEARFQQRKPVDGKDILALQAFAFEHGNGPLRPRLDRALTHGTALADDFAAAFAYAQGAPALEQDVWMLLAEVGAGSQLLTFAVGLEPAKRASLPLTTRSKIAERLLAAGLPNAASDWVQSDDVDTRLAARVALANGDARTALRQLSANLPDAPSELLAAAYIALGEYQAAAASYESAGNSSGTARMQRWAGLWPDAASPLPDASAGPWADAAAFLEPVEMTSIPPLQAGQARLEQSAATRSAISRLLSAAPMVTPVPPP